MPRYTPRMLPRDPMQEAAQTQNDRYAQNRQDGVQNSAASQGGMRNAAFNLGQQIKQEHGMQGVRRYLHTIREFFSAKDLNALAQALGVPPEQIRQPNVQQTNAQSQQAERPNQQPMQQEPQTNQQNNAMNNNNMNQMLQMLAQMGGMPNMANMPNMGNTGNMPNMGNMGNGGFNPMMLAQLMNGMNRKS